MSLVGNILWAISTPATFEVWRITLRLLILWDAVGVNDFLPTLWQKTFRQATWQGSNQCGAYEMKHKTLCRHHDNLPNVLQCYITLYTVLCGLSRLPWGCPVMEYSRTIGGIVSNSRHGRSHKLADAKIKPNSSTDWGSGVWRCRSGKPSCGMGHFCHNKPRWSRWHGCMSSAKVSCIPFQAQEKSAYPRVICFRGWQPGWHSLPSDGATDFTCFSGVRNAPCCDPS